MVEPLRYAPEIAAAIACGILEGAWINLIDDAAAPPFATTAHGKQSSSISSRIVPFDHKGYAAARHCTVRVIGKWGR